MLVAIYHILKDGVVFKDLGADYYNQFNKERKIKAYLKKLKALGWEDSAAGQPADQEPVASEEETAVGDKDLKYQIRLGTYTVKNMRKQNLQRLKKRD